MSNRTAEIARIVEQACAADSNVFGYRIWTHHITAVVENGEEVAPLFGADSEIVELAALLHDYASIKNASLYDEHHIHSGTEAEAILRRFDYPEDTIEAVKDCIATHRGSTGAEPQTPEGECLASADAMAHIQQVPSLLDLAYGDRDMDTDDGAAWVRAKLERSWQKLDSRVQPLIEEEYEAAIIVLTGTRNSSTE